MNFLEEKIVKEGIVKEGNVLKVDGFLNHRMDIEFINEIGKEFYRLFKDEGVNKLAYYFAIIGIQKVSTFF